MKKVLNFKLWESGISRWIGLSAVLGGFCTFSASLLAEENTIIQKTVQETVQETTSESDSEADSEAAKADVSMTTLSPEETRNRLLAAVTFVRSGKYEDALHIFKILNPEPLSNVVLISEFWFYRAVAEHQTFQKDACLASLDRLDALRFSKLNSANLLSSPNSPSSSADTSAPTDSSTPPDTTSPTVAPSQIDPSSQSLGDSADSEKFENSGVSPDSGGGSEDSSTEIPARYLALGSLIRRDVESLEDGSVEMISRQMRSVEQRLENGAAGESVQKSETQIVKMLDSLIDEMEEKAQKQKRLTSRKMNPGKPMDDARIGKGNGPGNVTRRDLHFEENWGTLPEKQREAVLQQLGRDFPPHYRDAIEQYFKRMAEQK